MSEKSQNLCECGHEEYCHLCCKSKCCGISSNGNVANLEQDCKCQQFTPNESVSESEKESGATKTALAEMQSSREEVDRRNPILEASENSLADEIIEKINPIPPTSSPKRNSRKSWDFKHRMIIKSAVQETLKRVFEDLNPLIVLLNRIDKGEYFNEDDKELKWRNHLRNFKKRFGAE